MKNRIQVEVTIGGFNAGTGNRSATFGALLVGRPRPDGSLAFAGGVGTGFNQARARVAAASCSASVVTDECPFSPVPPRSATGGMATWVRPDLRAAVEIAEFTNDGLVRHASFIDLEPLIANDCLQRAPTAPIQALSALGWQSGRMITRDDALALDAADPLAHFRDRFHIPDPA